MRRPAINLRWMSEKKLEAWVRGAHSREEYQKRLAIWMTVIWPFSSPPCRPFTGRFQASGVVMGEPVQPHGA